MWVWHNLDEKYYNTVLACDFGERTQKLIGFLSFNFYDNKLSNQDSAIGFLKHTCIIYLLRKFLVCVKKIKIKITYLNRNSDKNV